MDIFLAVTPGEPAGIGPDLCLQMYQQLAFAHPVFFCDPKLLAQRASQLHLDVNINLLTGDDLRQDWRADCLNVVAFDLQQDVIAGQLNKANSAYILETLVAAVDACITGHCDALVTAPVHKGIINDAGFEFSGHTEFIAERVSADPVMMLACPGLRVALATTHLPLKDVSAAITAESLDTIITAIYQDLKSRFGIDDPAIYVCGLNPHAGEGGHLGREEIETIAPLLEKLRAEKNMQLIGPLPADTLFIPKYLDHADVVLAMYHDQGLPVLKHMGFGNAVNITLGLPIIRTSVDHGTALDLAGSGKADTGSLQMAVETAIDMVKNVNNRKPN